MERMWICEPCGAVERRGVGFVVSVSVGVGVGVGGGLRSLVVEPLERGWVVVTVLVAAMGVLIMVSILTGLADFDLV